MVNVLQQDKVPHDSHKAAQSASKRAPVAASVTVLHGRGIRRQGET